MWTLFLNYLTLSAASSSANTTWQLYFQGIIMQDLYSPDPIGALEQNLAANAAVQTFWQETFDNLTSGRSGRLHIRSIVTEWLLL